MKRRDLTGMTFGRLTAHEVCGHDKQGKPIWRCTCSCGRETQVRAYSLLRGDTQSCGCLLSETVKKQRKRRDITGMTFDRLTAVEEVEVEKSGAKKRRYWRCSCSCGGEVIVRMDWLFNGHTRSCGCLHSETTKKQFTKHGLSKTYRYSVWHSMMKRCYNPSHPEYRNYGGRGITVCEEWRNPEVFCEWAKNHGCKRGLQLDRKDNNGNYCPDNCWFVTPSQNCRNKRTTTCLPSGEPLLNFCERWLGHRVLTNTHDYYSIKYHWDKYKRLPDFVFEAIRNRAIADLDATHR